MKTKEKLPYNEFGERHGYWVVYNDETEELWWKGLCINGKSVGYHIIYNKSCSFTEDETIEKIFFII